MKRARKTFKAILAVLHVGIVIAVSSWAFAQGGGISGSVKDLSNNQGIQGVIITVKDVSTGTLAGTGTTDALGNYSVGIPALGNYTLVASKLGYDNMTAPDVIELSDMTPNRTVNISMGGKAWLKEKPEADDTGPVLGDGGRQELPHPSPRNPGLPPSPQRVRPARLPQLCRGREKNLRHEPVNLLGPRRPRALGGRHRTPSP